MFSCKFAIYFRNTFSYEHLWTAASEGSKVINVYFNDSGVIVS